MIIWNDGVHVYTFSAFETPELPDGAYVQLVARHRGRQIIPSDLPFEACELDQLFRSLDEQVAEVSLMQQSLYLTHRESLMTRMAEDSVYRLLTGAEVLLQIRFTQGAKVSFWMLQVDRAMVQWYETRLWISSFTEDWTGLVKRSCGFPQNAEPAFLLVLPRPPRLRDAHTHVHVLALIASPESDMMTILVDIYEPNSFARCAVTVPTGATVSDIVAIISKSRALRFFDASQKLRLHWKAEERTVSFEGDDAVFVPNGAFVEIRAQPKQQVCQSSSHLWHSSDVSSFMQTSQQQHPEKSGVCRLEEYSLTRGICVGESEDDVLKKYITEYYQIVYHMIAAHTWYAGPTASGISSQYRICVCQLTRSFSKDFLRLWADKVDREALMVATVFPALPPMVLRREPHVDLVAVTLSAVRLGVRTYLVDVIGARFQKRYAVSVTAITLAVLATTLHVRDLCGEDGSLCRLYKYAPATTMEWTWRDMIDEPHGTGLTLGIAQHDHCLSEDIGSLFQMRTAMTVRSQSGFVDRAEEDIADHWDLLIWNVFAQRIKLNVDVSLDASCMGSEILHMESIEEADHVANLSLMQAARQHLSEYWNGCPWYSGDDYLLVQCVILEQEMCIANEERCPSRFLQVDGPIWDFTNWCMGLCRSMTPYQLRAFPVCEVEQNLPTLLLVDECRGMDIPVLIQLLVGGEVRFLVYFATQTVSTLQVLAWVEDNVPLPDEFCLELNDQPIDIQQFVSFRPGDLLTIRTRPAAMRAPNTSYETAGDSCPGSSQITWTSMPPEVSTGLLGSLGHAMTRDNTATLTVPNDYIQNSDGMDDDAYSMLQKAGSWASRRAASSNPQLHLPDLDEWDEYACMQRHVYTGYLFHYIFSATRDFEIVVDMWFHPYSQQMHPVRNVARDFEVSDQSTCSSNPPLFKGDLYTLDDGYYQAGEYIVTDYQPMTPCSTSQLILKMPLLKTLLGSLTDTFSCQWPDLSAVANDLPLNLLVELLSLPLGRIEEAVSLDIFTDGSFFRDADLPAGWAFVVIGSGMTGQKFLLHAACGQVVAEVLEDSWHGAEVH
ncbi:unnamed protein product [Durusdinium trenchii]|uniref:Anaphase-promoting complex subunit 1 n=1 Tax=Durusdinium trenchii TaxID=1381693 RepID=A0ABP0P9L0_9DINO